ncbi:MAG: MBL fold metallo-hydrolase [Bacilli bacterium]|nr:MBL fold metallo-hydrolase [Bacilli bacterium]
MKKLIKYILLAPIILIVFVLVGFFLLVLFYKPFGDSLSRADKEDYAKRSSIFKNGKFQSASFNDNFVDQYKDRKDNKGSVPVDEIPVVDYKYTKASKDDIYMTWFGHSSSLIQIDGLNILTDPIFEDRSSPFSFVGPKRFSKIPVSIQDLPNIDVVLLTHDHYDHVAYNTLKELKNKVAKFIVPLGIDKDLIKFGIDKDKIQNMAWWEETKVKDLTIACTPAQHFSGRFILDGGNALWSSWIIKSDNYTIFNSGDTGYSNHFKEISEKYDIDFAMLDGAQYNEAWHSIHMFPEESVQATIDLKAKVSMLEHFGAFVLSNHSWDDPINRFSIEAKEKNINYITPLIGETVNLKEYQNYQTEWWKDIK